MRLKWERTDKDYTVEWIGSFKGVVKCTVYQWKGGWSISGLDLVVSPFFREVEDAKAYCANHFNQEERLARWRQYMLTHEPPTEGEKL